MHSGNFVLILHTHLPWVLNHGNWPHGEDWLTEAVAECYIPLLNMLNSLVSENIIPKITFDISPVLCEQLENENFPEIFEKYCRNKITAANQDEVNFKKWAYNPHHIWLASYWSRWYFDRLNDFKNKYDCSIVKSLKHLQDIGAIEIMTCGATHGYLPLLASEKSVNLQIKLAVENYKKHFDRAPRGIWLPECAYRPSYEWKSLIPIAPFHYGRLRPGVEQILAKHEIEYFVVDEPLTADGIPLGEFADFSKERFISLNNPEYSFSANGFDKSPLSLYNVSSSENTEYGTAIAFTRHKKLAMQVWSGQIGYPGEPDYLDFHKKQWGSMLRYWRVTDNKADMMYKTLYHPDWTNDKVDLQSNHFIHHIENTANYYNNSTGKFATVCIPFDTELFGHWWFEGPEFLKNLIKGLNYSPYINTATASEQINIIKPVETMRIPEGSWGENNNHDVWSNAENKWTWVALYNDENRLKDIYERIDVQNIKFELKRVLLQALREFLLEQASDWQFLIYTKSAKDYAEQRLSFHHSDFNKLCDMAYKIIENIEMTEADVNYLEETEKRNSPFSELKLEWWSE